jgi:hypothetical protein
MRVSNRDHMELMFYPGLLVRSVSRPFRACSGLSRNRARTRGRPCPPSRPRRRRLRMEKG